MVRKGLTVVPGGYSSVILVVIIGFRQWGVRKDQNMAQNGPRVYTYICKVFGFEAAQRPLNRARIPETDSNQLGKPLGSIYGVLDPFRGLYRAPKPTVLNQVYSPSRIPGHILTFPDPPSQPGQIILVQNDLYRCPTYSTLCFLFNQHLWGVSQAL